MQTSPRLKRARHCLAPTKLFVALAADEVFGLLAANIVFELLRRGLEEIRGWANNRAAQFSVESDLGAAHGVDDDTGRVGAVRLRVWLPG